MEQGQDLGRAAADVFVRLGCRIPAWLPAALLHNLKHNKVLHEKNIILTVVTEEVPRLRDEGRVTSERLSDAFSRVTVRFGFMEHPNVPNALKAADFDLENASFFLSRRAAPPLRSA